LYNISSLCRIPFYGEIRDQRQHEIKLGFQFNCKCIACAEDFPVLALLPFKDAKKCLSLWNEMESSINMTVDEKAAKLQLYFKYITKNIQHHPSKETALAFSLIASLLYQLSEKSSYPF
jgi:hypothetical protein